MAKLSVSVSGSSQMRLGLDKQLKNAVSKLAAELQKQLRAHTPVDTGRARNGWITQTRRDGAKEVHNRVPYIERLENNWSKQTRGQGIVQPAIKKLPRRIR